MRLALECRRRVKEQQKRIGQCRVPQHAIQLHVGQGRRGEVRGHAGTAKRRPCRSRSAAARSGVDHQPWQSRRRLRPVPHRGHGRAGGRCAHSESPGTEGVLRVRQIRRSKFVRPVGRAGWRSKPKGTRVLGAVARVRRQQSRSVSRRGRTIGDVQHSHQPKPAGWAGRSRRTQSRRLHRPPCTTPSTLWSVRSKRGPASS